MAIDPLMERTEFILGDLQRQGGAELCLSAGSLEKDDEVTGYGERNRAPEVLFYKSKC